MKLKLLILVGALLFLGALPAYPAGPGTSAANFLKIAVGARASGLGEAFTAVADDATCTYWNPAGLSRVTERQVWAAYNHWFAEIQKGYLALAFPLNKGALALALNYVDLGTLEGRDEDGNPTGDFGASDCYLSLSYAKAISEKLCLGLGIGWLQDTINESQMTSFLGNLGLLYLYKERLNLAVVVQNLGGQHGSDPLPLIFKTGFSYQHSKLLLAADLVQPSDNDFYFCLGTEYQIKERFSIRLGYKSGVDVGPGFSLGAGFKAGRYDVDYAYVPYGEIGESHRISFGMSL